MAENPNKWALTNVIQKQLKNEQGFFDWIRSHIPSPSSTVRANFTAQENIPIYRVVTSTGFITNSSTLGHRGKVLGISDTETISGFIGTALVVGEITNSGWSWTAGDIVYINGTSLSTTPPTTGFLQRIGVAVASDRIDIQIQQSVLL